ncbi:MAG: pilus assembly protein TadG-related protein, partial [Pirellulaceae bacterium]|nr:pilus assembly protein TadG-related protein [Pirellulaceae bacterium]
MKIQNQMIASRKGSTTVVFVLLLNVIFILGVFILEYSYLKLAKTELRIAVDACSRAASAEYGVSKDLNAAIAAAQEMAGRYRVGRSQFSIGPSDVIVGTIFQVEDGTYEFQENGTPTNAFRISTGYTKDSVLGAMDSLFASIHGVEEFQIQSLSTVAEIDLEVVLVLDR